MVVCMVTGEKLEVVLAVRIDNMKYYTDGFLVGPNPSKYGGYVIANELNEVIEETWLEQDKVTNNDAEIQGLISCLELSKEGDEISTDSMVALTWVRGGKSKSRPDLNSQLQKAKILLAEKGVNIMWEGRDFNLAGIYIDKEHSRLDKEAGEMECDILN